MDPQVQRSALHFRSRLQGIEEVDTLMCWDTFHPWIDFHGQVDGLDVQFFNAAGLAYRTSDASSEMTQTTSSTSSSIDTTVPKSILDS